MSDPYIEWVLPRVVDLVLGRPFEATRARVTDGLCGQVLEIGFGSGRNLRHLPAEVSRLLAVEPASGATKLAGQRIAESPVPVELIGLDGQQLPLPDESVDHVLVTWTLCTIPDVHQALTEMNRVLRPGGTVHFAEHGRSPNPWIARWQDALTPVWAKLAGGCHLNRPVADLFTDSGFTLDTVTTRRTPASGPFGFFLEGVATKSSS